MSSVKKITILVFLIAFSNCSNPNMLSNLFPDGKDRTSENSTGLKPGSVVSDFSLYLSTGAVDTLSNILATHNGVVLYFTMWCSTCQNHMDFIKNNIQPFYPNTAFYLIDYVSSTVTEVYNNQSITGYLSINAALDKNKYLSQLFGGTMGSTIVIDKNFVLSMNEDFKDGQRLITTLDGLP